MGLLRQTRVLTFKDLKIVALRRWPSTILRALALPIAYIIFIAYARDFFLPPSRYGFGEPRPIRHLYTDVFNSSTSLGGRDRVVFINDGYQDGEIDELIERLSVPLRSAGADVRLLSDDQDLLDTCQSSLSGFSRCFASASFHSSPSEGAGGWSYTARIDAGLGFSVFVGQDDNAAQVYVLPFLQAIDSEIASMGGSELPAEMLEQPFTYETIEDRENDVQQFFMRALGDYLAVTLFIAICGIVFHLPGYIAVERESGIASLVDIMSHDSRPWITLIARLTSHYASFAAVYVPGWLAIGTVVSQLIFVRTAASIVIPFHLLLGLALTGYALLVGSFFKRAQLSGVAALIISLAVAVAAQFVPRTLPAVTALGLLFPPSTYTFFAIQLAEWEQFLEGAEINQAPLYGSLSVLPGYIFYIFLTIQIVVYPFVAAMVQWSLHGTSRSTVSINNDSDTALELVGISKTYKSRLGLPWIGKTVHAVQDLNLTIRNGQLATLLGVNGSGKSTLLAGITGTQAFSSGSMLRARGAQIGFCPQSNVAWSDLTVIENVTTFAKLKTSSKTSSSSNDIDQLIIACDLNSKRRSKPLSLSGGQRRKLQLAMAFIGRSAICCVDEASSGLDPLSRRKIWEILLAERGRRTIILTTHALDEADALSDHIAVMARGRLLAEGSSAMLKAQYGGGFVVKDASGDDSRANTIEDVRRLVADSGSKPIDIQCPTIEDAFLTLAASEADDWTDQSRLSTASSEEVADPGEKKRSTTATGTGTNFPQQVRILFRKRLLILRRNSIPSICAMVVPALVAGLSCYGFINFEAIPCTIDSGQNTPQVLTLGALERYWGIDVPVGPSDSFSPFQLPRSYRPFFNRLQVQDSYQDFQDYIHENFRDVAPGGLYLGDNATAAPLVSYRINGNPGYSALAKNLADSYLTGITIDADFSTFALPFTGSTGDSLQLILYITLGLCVYPAFLALYPTYERLANVRALHYSSGVRPAPLWLAYSIFDGVLALLMSIVVIAILTGLSNIWYAPGYLFVCIFLYGICSNLLAYTASLFAKTQLAAFAVVAGYQAVSMLIYFVLYLVCLTFGSAELLQHNLNVVQWTYGLICPAGSLFRAMLLTLNQSQILCREREFVGSPGGIEVYGGPILYLVLQSMILYIILVLHDSHAGTSVIERLRHRRRTMDTEKELDGDVAAAVHAEATRAAASTDVLRLLNLTKHFGKDTAVDNVTLGVPKGTILALLGPNGAGKTTTIGLVRGDLQPSSAESEVLISSHSIQRDRIAAHRHLGICPQFNATDRVTVTEHLAFYARIRGVSNLKARVQQAVRAFGLFNVRSRLVAHLSGGNQRRLSLATAMIGNPTVVLLDEPSTGMDALAMRKMWALIAEMKKTAAVVITTHSMEEADVLSDKAAIIRKRILAVGSSQDLRNEYAGDVYLLHLVFGGGSKTSTEATDEVLMWLERECPGTRFERTGNDSMHGQVRCQVRFTDSKHSGAEGLLRFLEVLERSKAGHGVAYYSVSRPTLEDVFLDILQRHS